MTHTASFRVYYEDTDAGGIVYYANYLKFAERGRTEFLREMGFENGTLLQEQSVAFVVRRLEADYRKSARLDDLICVETRVESVKNASFVMKQSLSCQNDVVFSMLVTLACVGKNHKPVRLPDGLADAMRSRCERGAKG